MQWTLRGAHLLLQTRTKVLNGELAELFRGWFPKFQPQPDKTKAHRKAAVTRLPVDSAWSSS